MDVQEVLGISVRCVAQAEHTKLMAWFAEHELLTRVEMQPGHWAGEGVYRFQLAEAWQKQWILQNNTLSLRDNLKLKLPNAKIESSVLLEQEIIVALLACPYHLVFPCAEELFSSVRIRRNIAQAGALTALAFGTETAERPPDSWTYDEDKGFTVLPGINVIDALKKATQPEITGSLYTFSCYRATEYVMMLGIAQELVQCNPTLLGSLQQQCEKRVVRSGQFHEVFLREYGTQDHPVAAQYYVPGDRVWFRNPDEKSSDIAGFEGSWVLYLGGGLFTNFWKRDQPFTIEDKCLEIFHWRHGVVQVGDEEPRMDESEVERRVKLTRTNESEVRSVLAQMLQPRAPKGVYNQGGCVDTTRESPRWVCAGSADLVMPDV